MSEDKLFEALRKTTKVQSAAEAAQVAGWVSTGNYALNYAISNRFLSRGWALGHVAEIFGDESTGKSYLIARALAEVQRLKGVALLDDTEHRFNPEWARRKLGVDVAELIYHNSQTVEEHHELLEEFLKAYGKHGSDRPVVATVDSLAALTTEHEKAVGLKKPSMTKAKLLRAMFRLLVHEMQGRPIAYLAANQQYEKIGASPWEKSKVSSGGGAFKYQSSVRISLRTPKKVKDDGDVVGVTIRAVVEKNSVAPPYRETEMTIPFDRPINPYSGLVSKLLELGYLSTTSGHKLVYDGEETDIPGHKTDFLKQDESAVELLTRFPKLLEEVDADLARREEGPAAKKEEEDDE